jgi:hypothetical protein
VVRPATCLGDGNDPSHCLPTVAPTGTEQLASVTCQSTRCYLLVRREQRLLRCAECRLSSWIGEVAVMTAQESLIELVSLPRFNTSGNRFQLPSI